MKRVVCILAILPLAFIAQAQNNKIHKENIPSWVTVQPVNYSSSQLDNESESGYVDLDYENQISVDQQATFSRTVFKIISEAGVQNRSEISINFDPEYQQLIFHTLRIIRGSSTIDQLRLSKFKLIQQEKELDKHLYDGSLTAFLPLEDVRKGDVIEYSYTLKGFNPIFNDKFTTVLDAGYSVPICNLYHKIIVPKTKALEVKNSGTNVQPAISDAGNEKIYEWKFRDVRSIHEETETPSWYDVYPVIMVSEYKDWKEIAAWASNLFRFPVQMTPALARKIDEIKNKYTTEEARALAALRFVQDDIRYTGIEMGESSHKPHLPGVVFNQRFGDCKDKSYLLCTMLREMGIKADPVLINTVYKKTIASWLPSPKIFDHTTVRAVVNNKVYYFDATIQFQRGRLETISYPDYQCGLLITDTTSSLTMIPSRQKGGLKVKEIFNITDSSSPVSFIVKTEFTSSFADNARYDFQNNSIHEMQKKYREAYTGYFDNITSDSLVWKEDSLTGNFITTEYYTIDDFWKSEPGTKKVSFSPYVVGGIVRKPEVINRKMPYELAVSPYDETIEIDLPEDWDAEPSSHVISCAGFNLKYRYETGSRQVVLHYEYEGLKDHLTPTEMNEFMAGYKEFEKSGGYDLTWPTDGNSSLVKTKGMAIERENPYSILYGILALSFIITFVVRQSRRSRES